MKLFSRKSREEPKIISTSDLSTSDLSTSDLSASDLSRQQVEHDGMTYIVPDDSISQEEFTESLHASDTYYSGSIGRQNYIDSSITRLYRIFTNLFPFREKINGPTLDVASGWGLMYPVYRKYFNTLLPYKIAELGGWEITIDGDHIIGCKFECEKDILTFEDQTFGMVFFCDCIEHLVVDPLWPLLEFNRVLNIGGHIAITTPNAVGAYKLFQIAQGANPASENQIKPSSIYQRHNREWTPIELKDALTCCGFGNFHYSSCPDLISTEQLTLLNWMNNQGMVSKPFQYFGPELFIIAEKMEHLTLDMDLPKDRRWPDWLYTSVDSYRKRPSVFPIVVSDDYA